MNKFEGTNYLDFKRELLKDAKEREAYERLKPKYDMIRGFIERRNQLSMSQKQLAMIIGTQQPAIARLESGNSNTRISTLFKVADALGLDMEFRPRSPAQCNSPS